MFDLTKLQNPKGHVELIETIGKGNFGYVYKGKLVATQEITAVKVVLLKEDELREILLEVEILRDCKHDNVTRFMGNFIRNDDLWICMEFCGGGAVDSLYKALSRPLTEEEIAILLMECLKGLFYLHSVHIIHRDIKSGNILLTESGGVKLADFGVSALTNPQTNYRAHTFIGTPYWMAPEVIMSENSPTHMYDSKADIWSIGITAIELADKNPPMNDIHPMRALHLIPTVDPSILMLQNPKKWSKPFVNFISSCLIKDPRRRPSADDILKHAWLANVMALSQRNQALLVIAKLIQSTKAEKLKKYTTGRNSARKTNVAPIAQQEQHSSDEDEFEGFGALDDATTKESHPGVAVSNANGVDLPSKESPGAASTTSIGSGVKSQLTVSPSTTSVNPIRATWNNLFKPIRNRSKSDVLLDTEDGDDEEIVQLPTGHDPLFDVVPLDIRLRFEVFSADLCAVPVSRGGAQMFMQFLLLGTEKGLYAADITHHDQQGDVKPYEYDDGGPRIRPIIPQVRFRQIQVMEDYEVMLSLCGKYSHIRSYHLTSLKKLIRFIFRIKFTAEQDFSEEALVPGGDDEDDENPNFWLNNYSKILNSRDAYSFVVTRTTSTCYMGALFAKDIVLYEWAKLPYLRFMKVKQFWLPETPKFFSILHDGHWIVDLMVVYEREANRIEFESSKVIEVELHRDWKEGQPKACLKDKEQCRWLTWIQLPLAVAQPTDIAGKPKQTPSWYDTIKNMKPRSDQSPPPPRDFLATFGARSRIVNADGYWTKQSQAFISWAQAESQSSDDSVTLLGAAPKRVLVCPAKYWVGVHQNYVEVLRFDKGDLLQAFRARYSIKMEGPGVGCDVLNRRRGRMYMVSFNKKKKFTNIYWLRERQFDHSREEQETRVKDRIMRPSLVVGTGLLQKV